MLTHSNAHEDTYGKKVGQAGGTSITEKRQGNAHNRHDADNHTDIDNNLSEKHGCYPNSNNFSKTVFRLPGNFEAPDNQ